MVKKFQRNIDQKSKKFFLKDFGFRFLIILGVCLLFFIVFKYSKEAYKQKTVNREIAELQAEIDKLNQDNKNLQGLIEYFQTDDFKEKETKDKLNLVKEGERLVLIKEKEIPVETVEEDREVEVTVNRPNYYHWWYYFFGIDKTTQFGD
ncbi:MAG: septum formation initiator family protein [Patescibacteria group bacterium]|nr:septum formation initiator family protein [Patescibacteria group bacterium]